MELIGVSETFGEARVMSRGISHLLRDLVTISIFDVGVQKV
jgi:hypothetical protein